MVNADPRQRSDRYLADTTGAPPLPPPGGYAGAARPRGADQSAFAPRPDAVHVELPHERRRRSWFGWVSVGVASVFAVVLLVLLAMGDVDVLYSLTLVAVQLLVVGLVVAATLRPASRVLGAVALSVTLVLNVATVGAFASTRSAASGGYEGHKSDEDRLWESYPGIKDVSPQQLLDQASLETVRERSDALSQRIRAALSQRFGYTWTPSGKEDVSPVRNGYGGESLVTSYLSAAWMTEQPITSIEDKYAAMDVIDEVIAADGMGLLYPLNAPESGLDPDVLTKLYGSDDVATQSAWEWYSPHPDGVSRLYANIFDLTHDTSGSFTRAREAAKAKTGEPTEGLEIVFTADEVLSEDDVTAFRDGLQKYR